MEKISLEIVLNLVKEDKFVLKSTHESLCYPIIERIYKKMTIGIKFQGIKVDGDLIIDGHHRYLASILAGISLERYPSQRTSATRISDWKVVNFVEEDWDTEAKILILNQMDAKYNNLTQEQLNDLLK